MNPVIWCDDLDAPTVGMADMTWWDERPHGMIQWLEEHGGSAETGLGIIFLPNEEIKMLFILKWL